MMRALSERVETFGACITRLSSLKTAAVGGINLAQGFPEQDPPPEMIRTLQQALMEGKHQYADMRGLAELRAAVSAHRAAHDDGFVYDPDTEVTITCGATEAMAAALQAIAGPGDEVLVQEPAYENYPPQVTLSGATARRYRLTETTLALDVRRIAELCGRRTKAIVVNTPNNPTGRVFSRDELEALARLCRERDLYVLSDEVYQHLIWDGRDHVSPAACRDMRARTIVIGSLSKGYAATGWRVGWAMAPAPITAALRRVHDFLTGCAPTAAQHGAVTGLQLPREFYAAQRAEYESRRNVLAGALRRAGLRVNVPEGAYYFFVDVRPLDYDDSERFADDLLKEAGIGVVPWRAFFTHPTSVDRAYARINFAKSLDVLERAAARLGEFAQRRRRGLS